MTSDYIGGVDMNMDYMRPQRSKLVRLLAHESSILYK